MIEPPSKQLQQVLFAQKLCTERDLKRCRKHVRRLSGDLPAFDSVWLDALVQSQKLTAYQASLIESGQHDNLRIGPSIVLDRIGGTSSETFLAKDAASKTLIVVKRMSVPAELKADTLTRLQELVEQTRGIEHSGLVLPHACSELGTTKQAKRKTDHTHWIRVRVDLAIASRLVEGLSLGELLLRRGRFPPNVVIEIARQVLDELSVLHDRGVVHGEIGLHNLRLPSNGQLLLLDAGITPALQPELQINAFVRPDRYDGIAPELIGTGQHRTPQSDFYALGTILWQLLAGRPPFTTGDPLAKLAAHQLQRLIDVRELAPETPERLARLITWLTERDPALRPSSAKVVLSGHPHSIGPMRRSSRSILAAFASSFRQPPVRALPRPTSAFPKVVAAAAASVLLAAGAVIALHGQTRNWVLAELPRMGQSSDASALKPVSESTSVEPVMTASVPQVQALPKPDANGIIELDANGLYRAEKVIWRGHKLTLRGQPAAPAVVQIDAQPLRLRASFEIVCQHVRFEYVGELKTPTGSGEEEAQHESLPTESSASRRRTSVAQALPQLTVFESQELRLTNCQWKSPLMASSNRLGPRPVFDACVWVPHNAQDFLKRKLNVRDSQFLGAYSTIHIAGAGRDHEIEFDNVLKTDGGPLLLIEPHQKRQRATMTIELNRSTVRACDGIVGLKLREGQLDARLAVTLIDTVLDLAPPSSDATITPAIALIGERLSKDWTSHVSLTAQGSYSSNGLTRYGLVSPDGSRAKSLDAAAAATTGLITAGFTFRGPDLLSVESSLLDEFMAPRRSESFPGIQEGESP